MAGRPHTAVPNIFASEGAGIPNNIPLLDADFADVLSFYNDSAIGWVNYVADTGAANAYVATLAAPPSSYLPGFTIPLKIANTNTGASTINVNALGSQAIVNPAGIALQGGELLVNKVINLVYDGTNFRIRSFCPLNINLANVVASQAIECAGYDSAAVAVSVNSAINISITLQHLAFGVPITIYIAQNLANAAANFKISATEPGGTAYLNVTWRFFSVGDNSGTNMTTTGYSFATNGNRIASGSGIFGPSGGSSLLMTAC